jgi:hypothetical protein
VQKTADLDGLAADLALVPRLKAVRQSMRSIGNWAAGKYIDAAMRVQLREKLLEQFRVILGETAQLPSAGLVDELLNQVDDPNNTPYQLIVKCRQMFEGFK